MTAPSLPHLRATHTSKQLIVNGKPFLVRGAELQNSSFSSAEHMEPLWKKMVDMNVNTVLGSVSWEIVEPVEGQFDFSLVDRLIGAARAHGLKLILLWFGAWKNGISTYAPSWVKLTPHRFPRVVVRSREGKAVVTEILSCVYGETIESDARAFKAFMTHLKAFDEDAQTVIMVQVENEVGVLGDSRDYSAPATTVFEEEVPHQLVERLNNERTSLHPDLQAFLAANPSLPRGKKWTETFGQGIYTDELFMAYHYACYIDRVAQAGKSVYALPMFANFWLNYGSDPFAQNYDTLAGGGVLPGDYPSGGAVGGVLDIWQMFAPSLDFISPDTYLNDYHRVCETYRHRDQPLFIPEQRRDEYGARRSWLAIGAYRALGACPFALDTLEPSTCAYTKHYGLMAEVEELVLAAQQKPDAIVGFFFDELDHPEASSREDPIVHMGGFEVVVQRAFTTGPPGPGYGFVIHLGTVERSIGKFLLVGAGFQVKFKSLDANAYYTGILDFEEKRRDRQTGEYVTIRRLNGDETRSGQQAIMPNESPDDGGFPIHITIPAVTKIALCNVYQLTSPQ